MGRSVSDIAEQPWLACEILQDTCFLRSLAVQCQKVASEACPRRIAEQRGPPHTQPRPKQTGQFGVDHLVPCLFNFGGFGFVLSGLLQERIRRWSMSVIGGEADIRSLS